MHPQYTQYTIHNTQYTMVHPTKYLPEFIYLAEFMERIAATEFPDDQSEEHEFGNSTSPAFPLMKAKQLLTGSEHDEEIATHTKQTVPTAELHDALETATAHQSLLEAALAVNIYITYTTFTAHNNTIALKQDFFDAPANVHKNIERLFNCSKLGVWTWLTRLGLTPSSEKELQERKDLCYLWWEENGIGKMLMRQMLATLWPKNDADTTDTTDTTDAASNTGNTGITGITATLSDMCV